MILATYTLVTNGSFISVRTGRDRPSGNPSTHLSSLSPPPATAAPGQEPPLRAGGGGGPCCGPRPLTAWLPPPHSPRAGDALPPSASAPRGGRDPLGAAPAGPGAEVAGGVSSPSTAPCSRRASPSRRSLGDRAAESALALALGELGGVASPLLPHSSRWRACYHVSQINK